MPALVRAARLVWLASALFLIWSPSSAVAQRQLIAEPELLSSMARSGSPIPLVWRLIYEGTGLLEGQLEVAITDGESVLGRVRVTDLVLTNGETQISTLLPTVAATNQFNTLELRLRFIHEGGRMNLGKHTLRAPGPWQRSLVVCICTPHAHAPSGQTAVTDSLRLERFSPDASDQRVVTSRSTVLPDEMPTDALFYCGFDLVLLTPDGLAQLKQNQLEAITNWVHAGGSLLVVVGRTLAPAHAAFLNTLFGAEADEKPFVLDPSGRLLPSEADATVTEIFGSGVRLANPGLGRSAVLMAPSLEAIDVKTAAWRQIVASLWRIRRDQMQPVVHGKTWDVDLMREAHRQLYEESPDEYNEPELQELQAVLFAHAPITSGNQLLRQLMPKSVRVVPWSLIALVLIAYVIAIGPGDYLVLGWFKRRKLTWVAFPLVTLAFTLFAVWLSHYYMRTTDRNNSLILLDMGDHGEVVRQNQFELVFAGTRRRNQTEIRRGLFAPLNHLDFSSSYYYYDPRRQSEDSLVGAATYTGRLPYLYAASQDIPQWTPQLNRVLSIAPEAEAPQFDWRQFDGTVGEIWNRTKELTEQLQLTFGQDVTAWVFQGRRSQRIVGHSDLFDENQSVYTSYGRQVGATFINETSVRSAQGMYALVSRMSPTGSPNFEDLPLLDPTDARQWLLVIAVPSDSNLLIYRKLYTGHGPPVSIEAMPTGTEDLPLEEGQTVIIQEP